MAMFNSYVKLPDGTCVSSLFVRGMCHNMLFEATFRGKKRISFFLWPCDDRETTSWALSWAVLDH